MNEPLPVEAVLPEVIAALDARETAVLVAPPGAGKTTMVAPALLGCPWAAGKRILLLSPRRLAARAAAERMAALRSEAVGQTIGYRTRMDSKVGPGTRVEVLTEGIFARMIIDDPELTGVAAVLFDEVHERNLEGDLGLALAIDARGALRPDLRLLAMSATLDGARYAALLDAPVIESAGRMFPVTPIYLGRDPRERIEDAMARAIHRALASEPGSILAFLPGSAEIERTADRLVLPADTDLHRLYGALEGSVQRAAIAPPPTGRRKVVLATSIAETSLTIDGVRVVIDSGLARRARYDRNTATTQLVTERAAQSAVTQRAGRAGRTATGVAWRLWEKAATAGLPPFDPPEMLQADLAGLVLDLRLWGVTNPASLAWLDPPPPVAVAESVARLTALGALDEGGHVTLHGKALAALPLPPARAHMLLTAAEHRLTATAAEVAVLLGERGLGGNDADLETRRDRWRRDTGPRATAARRLATRWVAMTGPARNDTERVDAIGRVIALGHPDRIARARNGQPGVYLMAGGRAVRVDAADPLARNEWLAVADVSGSADGARVLAAAPLSRGTVDALFSTRIEEVTATRFVRDTGSIAAETVTRLGAIILSRAPVAAAPAALAAAWDAAFAEHGLALLPWDTAALGLRARIAFALEYGAALPAFDDAALFDRRDEWLLPLLTGLRRLDALAPGALADALTGLLDWQMRQALDAIAPLRLTTPAGTSHAIDYADPAGPAVEVRVQELFGLSQHPGVAAGRVPLLLRLLSPAHRPVQTTRDLPGFWRGSWAAVKAEMKGRYPKHPWPDDPAMAVATTRTKRAQAARP
jgi:ATP-dependent helicase HrpB